MITVLLVIHIFLALALVAVILLQRSEGGALGIGGGNSFMTGRQAGNALTKLTAILAISFFITSLGLALLVNYQQRQSRSSIMEEVTTPPPTTQTAPQPQQPTTPAP